MLLLLYLCVGTVLIAKAKMQNEARVTEDKLIGVVSYAGRGFSGAQLCNRHSR